MSIEQLEKEYTIAENELLYIRFRCRNDPEALKKHEPIAEFNLKVAEGRLKAAKEKTV